MRRLRCELLSQLPKLAWLADLERATLVTNVLHGPSVEVGDGFVVEGCWNGPFEKGRVDDAETVVGSGIVDRPDAIVFVPPSNTLDSLFLVERPHRLFVSNSLPLILARCEERLTPDCDYAAVHDSIADGIDRYVPDIRTDKGDVRRLMVRNLVVRTTGWDLADKPLPPHFESFGQYADYLERTYGELVANIRDPARRQRIAIFSTQSRGYDTTAVNAIAAKHGLDKVFTCTTARDRTAFVDHERDTGNDDGTQIGNALGFECIAIDRLAFARAALPEEILYYASSYLPQDLNLLEINGHVDGVAVLLSGTFGEIWRGREYYEPHHLDAVSDELVRADLAQHGMSEVRLHVGLLPLPLPFVGARRRVDIYRIACLPEMQNWRAGASYEKPIARRLAEERGVARALFGQTKYNTTVAFPRPVVPHDPTIRAGYMRFLRRTGIVPRWKLRLMPLIHRVNEAMYYCSPSRHRMTYYLMRIVSRFRHKRLDDLIMRRMEGALFCFAVNQVADDYARRIAVS
jgi:hypothetical protein